MQLVNYPAKILCKSASKFLLIKKLLKKFLHLTSYLFTLHVHKLNFQRHVVLCSSNHYTTSPLCSVFSHLFSIYFFTTQNRLTHVNLSAKSHLLKLTYHKRKNGSNSKIENNILFIIIKMREWDTHKTQESFFPTKTELRPMIQSVVGGGWSKMKYRLLLAYT